VPKLARYNFAAPLIEETRRSRPSPMPWSRRGERPRPLDADLLRQFPLRTTRMTATRRTGGGCWSLPGARSLRGRHCSRSGALRAGAGKLQIATAASIAIPLASPFPEARVIGLEEN
jgi:hypothetical protein